MSAGTIRIGIGGWDFDPWRQTFYPPGLAKAKQLEHASRQLSAIEINATYYRTQSPALFERWAKIVPDGFKFAVKASRFCTVRKVLAEGEQSVRLFCGQGITALGDRLGPILWQFMGTKRFDADDFGAFLKLLPDKQDGVPLQHAIEARHESFRDPAFVSMCRAAGVAIVFGDGADYPLVPDVGGGIVYARLMRAEAEIEQGYPPDALDRWANVARGWAAGESPAGFPYVTDLAPVTPRDTYVFFIAAAKERNPAAAKALIERLA
ncbi:MAG TPA: DUF72 domain-containing protein [Allosphingosinicella sp.]|jgi:uncharacterized protein YecE (DUF72 family)